MSRDNMKQAMRKARLRSALALKKIRTLPIEQQAEANQQLMQDIARDLGITDENALQLLDDHAVKEFLRKLN
jgi:2-hydroxychromene-2-carboxylate isomerase